MITKEGSDARNEAPVFEVQLLLVLGEWVMFCFESMHIATFLLLKFGSRKGKCKVELVPSSLSATEVSSAIRYTSKPPDSSAEFGICVSAMAGD